MSRQAESDAGVVRLSQIVDAVRKGWLAITVCFLLSIALAGIAFTLVSPTYTSRAAIALQATHGNTSGSTGTVNTATETAVVTSSSVVQQAAILLKKNSSSIGDLTDRVVVSSPLDSQILEIRFTADSPTAAADGANAFAKAYLAYRRDLATGSLQNRADRLEQRIAVLDKASADAEAIRANPKAAAAAKAKATSDKASADELARELRSQLINLQTVLVSPGEIVDQALPPSVRNFPRLPVFLVAGALLGGIIGFLIAFVSASRNPRITNEGDLAELSGDLVLAPVPLPRGRRTRGRPLAVLSTSNTPATDAYRALASKVSSRSGQTQRLLLFPAGPTLDATSPLSLAVTMAARGLRVALVGTDDAIVQATGHLGIADPPTGARPAPNDAANDSGVHEAARFGQLRLVSLGDEVAIDATLHNQEADLRALTDQLDVLIVDAINVAMPSTRLSLAPLADEALVLVGQGRALVADIEGAVSELGQVSTPILGFVLFKPRRARRADDTDAVDASRLPVTAAPQIDQAETPHPKAESAPRVGRLSDV